MNNLQQPITRACKAFNQMRIARLLIAEDTPSPCVCVGGSR